MSNSKVDCFLRIPNSSVTTRKLNKRTAKEGKAKTSRLLQSNRLTRRELFPGFTHVNMFNITLRLHIEITHTPTVIMKELIVFRNHHFAGCYYGQKIERVPKGRENKRDRENHLYRQIDRYMNRYLCTVDRQIQDTGRITGHRQIFQEFRIKTFKNVLSLINT